MQVAGGTRLKVYESMAMGPVIVSTRIGVEGLPVVSGKHCFVEDELAKFAQAVIALLKDERRRYAMSYAARQYVEKNFDFRIAARSFEQACELAVRRRTQPVQATK